jgi:hypothetical protein
LRQLIVSHHEGSELCVSQVLAPHGRDFVDANQLRSFNSTMPSDEGVIAIDQDHALEAELADAVRELPDLLRAVLRELSSRGLSTAIGTISIRGIAPGSGATTELSVKVNSLAGVGRSNELGRDSG